MKARDLVQELRELGLSGSVYRVGRELSLRTGYEALRTPAIAPPPPATRGHAATWLPALPFARPEAVRLAMAGRIDDAALGSLRRLADRAAEGKILCFGSTEADYGDPIDWHRNPFNGARWPRDVHWSKVLGAAPEAGDVKLTWEAARFPQAYHLARAAALAGDADDRARWARAFDAQVRSFLDASTFPDGIHWASSQEMVIRLAAWTFALSVFDRLGFDQRPLAGRVAEYAWVVGHQVEDEIAYAERAVYNNHLVAEAFGLTLCARLLPEHPSPRRWFERGHAILTEQADRQVYPDGGSINQSHNYARTALQDYLLAARFAEAAGEPVPASWKGALRRSLAFLLAQQNPVDGSLPNYGSNDGSMPRVLSTCAFPDFRPLLQELAAVAEGRRLYPAGPWDEAVAWTEGPGALDLPEAVPRRRSVSFGHTGYHVLRGDREDTFAVFRCGSVLDRFSQIDMLHVDLTWRGHNVLADAGSYQYNGEARWHDHFVRTASHNTVTVDGADQMLHARRFKTLYRTEASLTRFEPDRAAGYHDGYRRLSPNVCHHRGVVRLSDDLWVVVDRLTGDRPFEARIHWLGGDFPTGSPTGRGASLELLTPDGRFSATIYSVDGEPLDGTIARGEEDPPRGWLARAYFRKTAVASFAVTATGPGTWVSVLAAGDAPRVTVDGDRWTLRHGQDAHTLTASALAGP